MNYVRSSIALKLLLCATCLLLESCIPAVICRSVSPEDQSIVIVTKKGTVIDETATVVFEQRGRRTVIWDDLRDRHPASCDIQWTPNGDRVLIVVNDNLTRPINIGYSVTERRLLTDTERSVLRKSMGLQDMEGR